MEEKNQNNLISSNSQNRELSQADISVLFSGDSYGLFVFQKTEKLVKAVYLLTGLMNEKEPMRERARALANKMLENALAMSDRVWGEESYQKNLISAISELSVLFDIAENTKMMSKMNHEIINTELKRLADFMITSSLNYSSAKIAFDQNLFDGNYNYVPEQNFIKNSNSVQEVSEVKENIIKDTPVLYTGNMDTNNKKENVTQNNKMSFTKKPTQEKVVKDKNNRQEIILSMLKSGVKLTIKDFAQNIKDCSEKTIQRELLTLVSKGILKKEGERRWSKYFIAK